MFSLQEDASRSYLILTRECGDEIDLLASYHDDRLTRKSVRRRSRKYMLSISALQC
jgi:hypothetical protein